MPPFFWFRGTLRSASRAEFPVSLSNHVGFTPRLLYSSTHHSQKVLPICKLVELKMLDFSDRTRTGISILTSAPDVYTTICVTVIAQKFTWAGSFIAIQSFFELSLALIASKRWPGISAVPESHGRPITTGTGATAPALP